MTNIEATYDSEELGYKTGAIVLDGDINLEVELTTNGYVVVKQLDEDTNIYRNVLVSSYCTKVKSKIDGWTEGKTIQIYTSAKPKSISYENIECIN